MKSIKVKEVTIAPGMELQPLSYATPGVYWVNGTQLVFAHQNYCNSYIINREWLVDDVPAGGTGAGGPSEAFVLALIDKAAFLLNAQPARSVRASDRERRA